MINFDRGANRKNLHQHEIETSQTVTLVGNAQYRKRYANWSASRRSVSSQCDPRFPTKTTRALGRY